MDQGRLTYDELLSRLKSAEEVVRTLLSAPTDAVVCEHGAHLQQLHQAEHALNSARQCLEQMLAERTRELEAANETFKKEAAERERIATALRESAESFRIVQDLSPDGFTILCPVRDSDGRAIDFTFVYENAAIAQLNGTDPKTIVGKRLLELFPGHRDTPFLKAYRQVADKRESCIFEAEYGGETLVRPTWFRIAVVPADGNIAVLAQDITAIKKAELALRASEELLRAVTDNTDDAIYVKDRQSRWVMANPALLRIVGKPLEEVLGKTDVEIYADPAVGKAILANDVQIMERGEASAFEERAQTPYGLRLFLSTKAPRRDAQGRVIGLVGISRDISEREKAEEEIRESRRKYQALIETIGDFVWEMDCCGRYTYCSPQMEKLWGMKPTDMIGRTPFDVMPSEQRHAAMEAFLQLTKSPRPFSGLESTAYDGHGRLIHIETSGVPFLDDDGKLLGFRGISRDVTERKRAEDALVRSEKLAAVGRIAATIAHEINNPLAAVMNGIFIAKTNINSPEKAAPALDLADEELRRIAHLTRQTLGFYRESSIPAPTSLSDVLDSAIDLLKGKIRDKQASLRRQYDAEIVLLGVAGELRQVFSNLLINGLEAIAQGGNISVSVSCPERTPSGPSVTVTVADDGVGIKPDVLANIFEPFFTTKEAVGTGLGLWVVKQLVEKHGGSISVKSGTEGQQRGTTFSIVLPVNAGAACAGSETSSQATAAG